MPMRVSATVAASSFAEVSPVLKEGDPERSAPPERLGRLAIHICSAEPDVAQHSIIEAEQRLTLSAAFAPAISEHQRSAEQLGESRQS
jgi:hypothetical protein